MSLSPGTATRNRMTARRLLPLALGAGLAAALPFAASAAGAAKGVLPKAIQGYEATCLASAPSFKGLRARTRKAKMAPQGNGWMSADRTVRVDLLKTEHGCACITTLLAPDANATAKAVLQASVSARGVKVHTHPDKRVAGVLEWPTGSNALEVNADTTGKMPLVRAILVSKKTCPKP